MGLQVWQDDAWGDNRTSQNGEFSNPITFKLSPAGGISEKQVYLRHDILSGENVEGSYDVVVEARDDFDVDTSSYIEVAPDVSGAPGTYVPSLAVGDILAGDIVPIWVRANVPNTSETGIRQDIYLNLNTSSTSQELDIDLSEGEFFKCFYDTAEGVIRFDTTEAYGYWISEWQDTAQLDTINGHSYDIDGGSSYIYFRTSADASLETADAWVGSLNDVDDTKPYLQIKVEFYPNTDDSHVGLVETIYGNTNFSVYRSRMPYGSRPYTTNPGSGWPSPKSIKYSGYVKIDADKQYKFRVQSDDGHYLKIGETLLIDDFVDGYQDNSGFIYLTKGYHYIELGYQHTAGDDRVYLLIQPQDGSPERAVVVEDFRVTPQRVLLERLTIHYKGQKDYQVDIQLYDGPDVPVLLDPENGYDTELFAPELTAVVQNAHSIEFQIDNSILFASTWMAQWIVNVTPTEPFTTTPPDGNRPHGVYYWRARGIYNGVFSEWSDWRFLEILPLVTNDEFLYLNANVGLEVIDPIIQERHLYLNGNVGLELHDPIVDDRFVYLNVNIGYALGEVIYPIEDDTVTRKTDFDGDENAFGGDS